MDITSFAASLLALSGRTPSQTCIDPHETFGNFDVALPGNEWDQVTLQPHITSTLGAEAAAIKQFADLTRSNPANSQTAFYILGTWPKITDGAYSAVWLSPSTGLPNEPVLQRRAFFDNLYSQADSLTDAPLRYIPTGEVFYRLGELIAVGELPGVTSMNNFYRDTQHLAPVGAYVAIATMLATLDKRNPHTIIPPAGFLSPEVFEVIHDTILDVMLADRRTGLLDFDDDGTIGASDLELWRAGDPRADANLDGLIDGSDFLAWQRGYVASEPAGIPTPEPSSLGLAILAMVTVCWRKAHAARFR